MKHQRTYYQILHVQPDAPAKIIKASYRTLMQNLNAHPDRGGDAAHAAMINHAYAVLSNPRKRAEYDRELNRVTPTRSQEQEVTPRAATTVPTPGTCPFCTHPNDYEREIPENAFCVNCKSPLCLAEQQRLEKTDQRKIARIGKQTALSYYTSWPQLRPYSGVTENISKHGMRFRTSQAVNVDSVIKIDCTQFQTIACVVNCSQAGNILIPDWHVGVKFLTIHFRSTRGVFISDIA